MWTFWLKKGRFFETTVAFTVFSASFRGRFILYFGGDFKNGQKSETALVGAGDRKALKRAEILVFRNGGRGGGGPEGFGLCLWHILWI